MSGYILQETQIKFNNPVHKMMNSACNIYNKQGRGYNRAAAILFLLIAATAAGSCTLINRARDAVLGPIPLTNFSSSAQYWYEISDQDRIIQPLPDQLKYAPEEYEKIADNILLFQKSNGGWPKNYDMQAILNDGQKGAVRQSVDALNTCFDNGATHSHLMYLGEVIARKDVQKYKDAYAKGLRYILSAQYENGGWPQFYPDTSGPRKYITYRDGAMTGIMRVLQRVVRKDAGFVPADSALYIQAAEAFVKGLNCIVTTQIRQGDTLYAWGQQYDEAARMLRPAGALAPAALCNSESADITEFLMSVENPSEEVKAAVEAAAAWFKHSAIEGIRIWSVPAPVVQFQHSKSGIDRMVMPDTAAPVIWARFYGTDTRQPVFYTREGNVVHTMTELDRELRVIFAWYIYNPQKVLNEYPAWKKRVYN